MSEAASDNAKPMSPAPGPQARYRESRAQRWTLYAAGALFFTVLVSMVGWVAWHFSTPPFRYQFYGYRILSDQTVEVTFEVTKDPDKAVSCTIRALNDYREEVGRKNVVVSAGERQLRVTETLRTRGRAVMGEVRECRLVGEE